MTVQPGREPTNEELAAAEVAWQPPPGTGLEPQPGRPAPRRPSAAAIVVTVLVVGVVMVLAALVLGLVGWLTMLG